MARPRVDLPPASELRALADGEGRLVVRVTPASRSEGISIEGGRIVVRVRARPVDGGANAAVQALLSHALDCAPSSLTLLRGATSREKLYAIPPPRRH